MDISLSFVARRRRRRLIPLLTLDAVLAAVVVFLSASGARAGVTNIPGPDCPNLALGGNARLTNNLSMTNQSAMVGSKGERVGGGS
jgi:hypothetical protein|tara:strand:+ start:356 stop:613 length:258 start_codon:yes stop_codon:yes gene_type:complete